LGSFAPSDICKCLVVVFYSFRKPKRMKIGGITYAEYSEQILPT